MSDRFNPLTTDQLAHWIFDELDTKDSILGIPRELFFNPPSDHRFELELHGRRIATPIGVAAGPHSQLAHNIVVAWLCGARVVELKTVQTLDRIEVAKPCIDMQDEGYNVEWSQELGLDESLDQYARAWVLVHALHSRLNFAGDGPGVLFDVSVGYDLDGILRPNMQRFLERVTDGGVVLESALDAVAQRIPTVPSLEVPHRLSSKATVSTMHGCPPEEIGRIAEHLMESWEFHTSIKLNPTLLGAQEIRQIMGDELGFSEIVVPDEAFEHDPSFNEAADLIRDLKSVARHRGLDFGVKLSNTLEVRNHRSIFDEGERTMYLSGRPLHALVVRLAHRLTEAFDGELRISFAGGADAFNLPNLLAAGLRPVTSCSDLLRPGGYLRLLQYLEELRTAMDAVDAENLDGLILGPASELGPNDSEFAQRITAAARQNLARYADAVLVDPLLARDRFDRRRTKTTRALGSFDCIVAPCTDACSVNQKVPEYMRSVREGDLEAAAAIVRQDNPMASILGRACHHPCVSPCLRTHLDDPLAIREIKRYITEHEGPSPGPEAPTRPPSARVAIVGGGPCGLSAATFLARSGLPVTLLEARAVGGGMVSATIPGFRATQAAIDRDLRAVETLGVDFRYRQQVGTDVTLASLREEGFDYFVIAAGAQKGQRLGIPGENSAGVWDGLVFLRAARSGQLSELSGRIGIVGGGDVAADCARTALRLGAAEATLLYRRTTAEMPALAEERAALREEGIPIEELLTPTAVVAKAGRIEALRCLRNRLGAAGPDGRPQPEAITGSEFEIPLDGLIVAIGQLADLSLFSGEPVSLNEAGYIDVDENSLETSIPGVFAGGDVIGTGPATIVEAAGDGRRIANAILERAGTAPPQRAHSWPPVDLADALRRRSRRRHRVHQAHTPASQRAAFDELLPTLSPAEAAAEAGRCLDCDLLCSTCESVCPNRAIFTYRANAIDAEIPRFRVVNDELKSSGCEKFVAGQPFQVAVLADHCNECGNCTTFCPAAGRPYRDKPRFYLDRVEFEAESDNAFMVSRRGNAWVAEGRFGGSTHGIVLDAELRYVSPGVSLRLNPGTFELVDGRTAGGSRGTDSVSLRECATLVVLLQGIRDSMPGFPLADSAEDL